MGRLIQIEFVKTIYNGMIAIADYKVSRAYEQNKDMMIYVGKEKMLIKWEHLLSSQLDISPARIIHKSKFGGRDYKMIYYSWNPMSDMTGDSVPNPSK